MNEKYEDNVNYLTIFLKEFSFRVENIIKLDYDWINLNVMS